MADPAGGGATPRAAKDRVIVALDVADWQEAGRRVDELHGLVGGFKVGLEALTRFGPSVVGMARLSGRVFYDGKFNDIPNTVGAAARAVAALGVWAFNLHASAGRAALEAAVANKGDSLVLAVTVLTSLRARDVAWIFNREAERVVVDLARQAAAAGCDGIICSPRELVMIRDEEETKGLLTVVPGVRPAWAPADDQARVMSPGEAIKAGADYLVIGRPITRPPAGIGSPAEAAERIVREIEEALS